MGLFSLQVINGLTVGMIYGMAALGFTMVYKALGYLNFSHSDTITIGAILCFVFVVNMKIPFFLVIPLVMICMLAYGFIMEKVIFSRFRKADSITFMLVSISLSTVVRNTILLIFGPEHHGMATIFPDRKFYIQGTAIPMSNVYLFLIALLILGLLLLFFNRTKFGLAVRLACEDPTTASMMGIRVSQTRAATFAITAALGGVAGMLVSMLYTVSVELGSSLALKTFIAAVVGGVGNFVGAVVGGLLVGVVESLSTAYISSAYKDAIVFAIGIITLAFFPYGLFRRVKNKL